jgi:hypothetical protein
MTEPCPDGVDVNSCPQQMGGRGMASCAVLPIATFRRAVSESLGGVGLKRSRTEVASATCSLKILCDAS